MKKYELDTVGQIYGAIHSKTWSPIFRLQATLHDVVSPDLLQQAADELRIRFPYIFVALKKGTCSYYLEENDEPLKITPDNEGVLTYYGKEQRTVVMRDGSQIEGMVYFMHAHYKEGQPDRSPLSGTETRFARYSCKFSAQPSLFI